jgi:hypothetical protein
MSDPGRLLETVKSLRPQELEVRLRSPRKTSDYAFKGCSLWDFARSQGLLPETKQQGSFSNLYFVAQGEDGMRVAVSFCEVSPSFTDRKVLLAYEQDGEPIRTGVRLVVPGDDLGGRSIYGLASIEARSVPYERATTAGVSGGIELLGDLERPGHLSIESLRALSAQTVETQAAPGRRVEVHPARSFSGPLLWDLLDSAGIQLDETIHEHFLRKIVVARGAEGFAVVIAGGEIEPRFFNAPIIAALEDPDGPLGEADGGIRLALPQDKAIARGIKGVVSLELREA